MIKKFFFIMIEEEEEEEEEEEGGGAGGGKIEVISKPLYTNYVSDLMFYAQSTITAIAGRG